ncbi:MAG: type I-B CRISPR-associated protein Cas5b [Bacillota bacterium]|jgi:CRISPR-associated protein Cas5t
MSDMVEVAKVLKVKSSALTTSFRYPHIMVGRLPTFELPPPATIYGHLCGVIGEWFNPRGLQFAYVFTHQGIGEDIELGQMLEVNYNKRDKNLGGLPRNVEGSLNPQKRRFLFKPQMTLYLKGPEDLLQQFKESFLSPRFSYILGRSQDLATCHSVEWVEINVSEKAFYSHTILPWSLRPWIFPGEPVYMPETINYQKLREPKFNRYLQLGQRPLRVFGNGKEEDIISREPLGELLVDNSETQIFFDCELPRGIWFHNIRGID